MRRLLLLARMPGASLLWSAAATAQMLPAPRSPTRTWPAQPSGDGRMFGHFPYADATPAGLASAPPGFALGQPCRLQPAVIADLARLLAARAASGVPGTLHAVSCYRSITHQQSVFCRSGKLCQDAAARARLVAPPGYSEHETGYAIDFAVRPAPGCRDTDDCIAGTPAGQWLLANGALYGFELSFPIGNAQGVSWEPWHWRWVGANGDAGDAGRARALFAAARARFPASPRIAPPAIRVAQQPPIPLGVLGTPTPPPFFQLPREKRWRR